MDFDPRRLAEVITADPNGSGRRGTGYRVTTTTILTAAHVVSDAQAVTVRFDADQPTEWSVPAEQVWCDAATDLAVLTIDPPGTRPTAPASFARLAVTPRFIQAHTAGFPLWKRRDRVPGPGGELFTLRDLHHGKATVSSVSNRRTGRLEVAVSPPRDTAPTDPSPWEGMSGAPLWSRGRIIGVIAEHHRQEGPNWLTAIRIDHCLRAAGADEARLAALLGVSGGADALPKITSWRTPRRVLFGAFLGTVLTAVAAVLATYKAPSKPPVSKPSPGHPSTVPSSLAPPSTFTLSGTLTITASPDNGSRIATSTHGCEGAGSYSDMSNGRAVVITDAQGRQVAVGSLRYGRPAGGKRDTCVMPFSVPDVPRGLPSYSITVSHRGTEVFTPSQAQAGVRLSMGP